MSSSDAIVRSLSRLLQYPGFLPACFIAFLGIRLAVLLIPAASPFSDAGWYLARAITLAEEGSYSEGGILTAFWPVGYPAFLALVFKLTGPSLLAAKLANLALAAASFWLLYRFVQKSLADELAARGAVLLLTIYPNNASYVSLVLTEVLYSALLLAASVALLSERGWRNVLLAGFLLGLATLVKTQTLILAPVLVLLAFTSAWSVKALIANAVKGVTVICIMTAVLAPWSWRNYSVFGEFVLVSTNGGISLLAGNNSSVVGDYSRDYSDTDPIVAQAQFSVADQVGADRRARALAWGWIRANPGQFLLAIPKKVFRLWAPDGEGEWGYQDTPFYEKHWHAFRGVRIANQAFYAIIMLLFIGALWRLLRCRPSPPALYGVGVVAVFTAISVLFSGQSRYHFPAMPFILAYASWFLWGPRLGGKDGTS